MSNGVVHWEMMSREPEKISAFYEKSSGWKTKHIPELSYRLVTTHGEGINGGIVKPESWPGDLTLYVSVDDLAAYRQRSVQAGGKILIEQQDVPGMGTSCLFADPDGRTIGLWQPKQA